MPAYRYEECYIIIIKGATAYKVVDFPSIYNLHISLPRLPSDKVGLYLVHLFVISLLSVESQQLNLEGTELLGLTGESVYGWDADIIFLPE